LPTSIVGPDDPIVLPADADNVHFEGELVIVIGRRARAVSAAAAGEAIFGVTVGNDISERDWQRDDLQWFRAKGCDTFGPIGPVIATDLDYGNLHLQTRVNGDVRQDQNTNDLVCGVNEIVSYISSYATLLPGDVIFTGTPGNTHALQSGDVVEVEIEGIGVLRNSVLRPSP
jgi:2-keto-4-pentenoate hydratase/2-oxohepta-3-ene-1,7-dioic acid hydratase in catechol pathway